jgi:hypothetical protein
LLSGNPVLKIELNSPPPYSIDDSGYCYTRLESITTINDTVKLLVFYSLADSCSSGISSVNCSQVYSLARFEYSGRYWPVGWSVAYFFKNFISFSRGSVCRYFFNEIISNLLVLSFEESSCCSGCEIFDFEWNTTLEMFLIPSDEYLFQFRKNNTALRINGFEINANSRMNRYKHFGGNESNKQECYWENKINWHFEESLTTNYKKLILNKTGTIATDILDEKLGCYKIIPINETTTYIFDEQLGEYVEEK